MTSLPPSLSDYRGMSSTDTGSWRSSLEHLSIESTLADLNLFDCSISASLTGSEMAAWFERSPLLPGAILMRDGTTIGMLSRRTFFREMSQRYSVDLFSRRPIETLLDYAHAPMFVLPVGTSIVEAANTSLARPPESLYEPIVVDCGESKTHDKHRYYLVDIHHVLVAQSRIHELTTQLLEAQTRACHQIEGLTKRARFGAALGPVIK